MIAFSLAALCLCLLLFCSGLFLLFIPNFPSILKGMSELFKTEEFYRWLGCGLLSISIVLTALLFYSQKRRFWRIKAGEKKLSIDLDVIREISLLCLKPLFPHEKLDCRVLNSLGQTLEIYLNLPTIPLEKQPYFLRKIEPLLTRALAFHCGYDKKYYLNASFGEESL